jgi:GNAT superfamily N-acetyltransferase
MRALYAHDVPDALRPDDATVLDHLDLLLDQSTPHRLAVAWIEPRKPVGLAAVAHFVSVSDPRSARWRQMELKELFVLQDHRSAGIGKALMAWVEREARAAGACRVDWHVKRENLRGIRFYQRLGAAVVSGRLSMRKLLLDD